MTRRASPASVSDTAAGALRGWRTTLALAAAVAAGYAAGSLLAWRLLGAEVTPVFFVPAGITSAALLLTPRHRWPAILVAAAATELGLDLWHGSTGASAVGFALANTVEPWLGAAIVRRRVERPSLTDPHHLLLLLLGPVLVGPLAAAVIGATVVPDEWWRPFVTFWVGDALGVLTIGGLILSWSATARAGGRELRRQAWPALAFAVATVAAVVVGFGWLRGPFILAAVVVFVAASRGMPAATTAAAAFAISANVLSAQGVGPYAAADPGDAVAWGSLQFFLAVTQAAAYALALGRARRDGGRRVPDAELSRLQQEADLRAVTSHLSTAATVREIGDAVARHGLAQVADIGVVGVLSLDGTTVTTVPSRALPPDIAAEYAQIPIETRLPTCDAIRTGRPVVAQTREECTARYPQGAATYRQLGVRGLLAVPIVVEGGLPAGALSFAFRDERAITPEIIATAQTLAAETAQALRRARAYEHERQVAHDLQVALLPTIEETPAPGVTVSAFYEPADPQHEVGGDWYDVVGLPEQRVLMVVGDAVGHDLRAATTMGKLQPLVRVLAVEAADPADALDRLDRASPHVDRSVMTTLALGDYDRATHRLRYACAGHPPPLLLDGNGARLLEGGRGLPLGVDAGRRRDVAEVRLDGPAQLVWYTDGLVERRGEALSVGLARLVEAVADQSPGRSPASLGRTILDRLTAGRSLPDDLVLLVVRLTPEPATPAGTSTHADRESS